VFTARVEFTVTYSEQQHRHAVRGKTLMRPIDFAYPSSASEHRIRTKREDWLFVPCHLSEWFVKYFATAASPRFQGKKRNVSRNHYLPKI